VLDLSEEREKDLEHEEMRSKNEMKNEKKRHIK